MTTDATTLDQLEITIALVASEETPEWLVVKTTVRINGESPLRNGDEFDFVDIADLVAAIRSPGTWFPWTCRCGYPGCAGYRDGVEAVHDGPVLVWTDHDAHSASDDAPKSFRFDAALAHKEVDQALSALRDRLASLGDEAAWVGADGKLAEDLADWYASTVIVGRDHIGPYRRRVRGDDERDHFRL